MENDGGDLPGDEHQLSGNPGAERGPRRQGVHHEEPGSGAIAPQGDDAGIGGSVSSPTRPDRPGADIQEARDEAWRLRLAQKYGVQAALDDPGTKDLVHRILRTGAEYEKTSDRWKHGVRSTPTMIVNNRMLIGTFPYSHLRTIFAALAEGGQYESSELYRAPKSFMEHWVMD